MFRKAVFGVLLLVFFVSTFCTPRTITVQAGGAVIRVPQDYPTIQAAVDAASSGDTIQVAANTYYENIVINKAKAGLSLIGENRDTTVIDGKGGYYVIQIDSLADNVEISGFTIQNGSEGILVWLASNCRFHDNIIKNNVEGINVRACNNITLRRNLIYNNTFFGVLAQSGIGYNICENNITKHEFRDLSLNSGGKHNIVNNTVGTLMLGYSSFPSTLRDNRISRLAVDGIEPKHYFHDIDTSNLVNGKPTYYLINQTELVFDSSTLPDTGYLAFVNSVNVTLRDLDLASVTVLLACCTNCTILDIALSNASYGRLELRGSDYNLVKKVSFSVSIIISHSNYNNITESTISGCTVGIYLFSSLGNRFSKNVIWNNRYGISLDRSGGNKFYYNNFFNNSVKNVNWYPQPTFDPNSWDDGVGKGNYWSNYTGADLNDNGIGDTPHLLAENNQDNYPLMNPYGIDLVKPVANAGSDRTVNEDTLVTLDGSNSSDNYEITSYIWAVTDVVPRTLSGRIVTYNFTTPGTYEICLNVSDAASNYATDSITMTVRDITPPVAIAGADQFAKVNREVSLSAGGSSDNVGIVAYQWSFGDGINGTGATVVHRYTKTGIYTVVLTVTDAAGNRAIDTALIAVEEEEFPTLIAVGIGAAVAASIAVYLLAVRRRT